MGWLDVDEMLDAMTPEQWREWIAAYNCGLDNDGWMQAGTVAAVVHNEMEVCRSMMAGVQVDQRRLRLPSHYVPYYKPTKKTKTQSHLAQVKKQYERRP